MDDHRIPKGSIRQLNNILCYQKYTGNPKRQYKLEMNRQGIICRGAGYVWIGEDSGMLFWTVFAPQKTTICRGVARNFPWWGIRKHGAQGGVA